MSLNFSSFFGALILKQKLMKQNTCKKQFSTKDKFPVPYNIDWNYCRCVLFRGTWNVLFKKCMIRTFINKVRYSRIQSIGSKSLNLQKKAGVNFNDLFL